MSNLYMQFFVNKGVLNWKTGWLMLVFLVFWDAFLTFNKGAEGNPLWQPVVQTFGINALWLLGVIVLAIFYGFTLVAGKYTEQKEHYTHGKEIVLTNLVIAFASYDAYLTFLLHYLGYFGTNSHYAIIPIIAVPVLLYNIWIERNKNLLVTKQWR